LRTICSAKEILVTVTTEALLVACVSALRGFGADEMSMGNAVTACPSNSIVELSVVQQSG
jgi:hypothetical protein